MEAAAARVERKLKHWLAHSVLLRFGVDNREGQNAHAEQDGGGAVGGGVVEVFHLVIEHDGKRARGAGNVAAEHEDYAELADGVQKTEHDGGEQRAARERNENAGDDTHGTGAEEPSGIDEGGVDRCESGNQRLHGKGKAVDDRADDEAIEGEGEGMAEEGRDAAADGRARAEQDEKKESEHGGRQNHGQSGQSFKRGQPAAAAQHEQRRERHGDSEKNRRGDRGQIGARVRRLASPLRSSTD